MSETEREGRVLTRRTRKALSRYRIDIDVCWIDKIRRAVTRRVPHLCLASKRGVRARSMRSALLQLHIRTTDMPGPEAAAESRGPVSQWARARLRGIHVCPRADR